MEITAGIASIILTFAGAFIFVLVSLFGVWHQKNYANHWTKRYWWMGWRPIFKVRPPNEKARWKIKLDSMVVRYGFIPPKHQWNIIGFLCVLVGFILQLKVYWA